MSVVQGTVTGITLVQASREGSGARKTYQVCASFGAATAGDTAYITGVASSIKAQTRNGKTITLRAAQTAAPGIDASGLAVYAGATALTVSGSADCSFLLCGTTTVGAFGASTGVSFMAVVDES